MIGKLFGLVNVSNTLEVVAENWNPGLHMTQKMYPLEEMTTRVEIKAVS